MTYPIRLGDSLLGMWNIELKKESEGKVRQCSKDNIEVFLFGNDPNISKTLYKDFDHKVCREGRCIVNWTTSKAYAMGKHVDEFIDAEVFPIYIAKDISLRAFCRLCELEYVEDYPNKRDLGMVEGNEWFVYKINKVEKKEENKQKENPNIIKDWRKEYDDVGCFREGRAWVMKDKKYGHVDLDGKVTTPLIYDDVWDFSEGRAWVMKDGKYGYVDLDGKVTTPLEYDAVDSFTEGRAWVRKGKKEGHVDLKGKVEWEEEK